MATSMERLEALLDQLEAARAAYDEAHRGGGSLAERVSTRDRLTELRADIARVRDEIEHEDMRPAGQRHLA